MLEVWKTTPALVFVREVRRAVLEVLRDSIMNQQEPKTTESGCIHCGHEPEPEIRPVGDWMRGIFIEDGACMWHRVYACDNSSCEYSIGDIWL